MDAGRRAPDGGSSLPHRSPIEHLTRDLARVIETMNCGLIVRDPSGDITFANETLLRWLGYTREELLGRPAEGAEGRLLGAPSGLWLGRGL